MKNEIEIIKQILPDINEDDIKKLQDKHTYIGEKLILDLVNGVGVVAKDLNDSKRKNEINYLFVGNFLSNYLILKNEKKQNLINQNLIEGLKATSKWLQDHDRHLTRVELKIKDIAEELYKTQDEILKFYSEFKNVDLRVELLEDFKNSAQQRFSNIEERLKRIEAQQHIDREIIKLGHSNLSTEIKIFTILDNLASGEFGLWIMFEKDSKKIEEQLSYLKNKIIKDLEIEYAKFIDFIKLSSEINKLEPIEKKAIEFISRQYQLFSNKKEYETIDLIALSSTNSTDKIEYFINQQSHIRTFMSYNDYIDSMINELLYEDLI